MSLADTWEFLKHGIQFEHFSRSSMSAERFLSELFHDVNKDRFVAIVRLSSEKLRSHSRCIRDETTIQLVFSASKTFCPSEYLSFN